MPYDLMMSRLSRAHRLQEDSTSGVASRPQQELSDYNTMAPECRALHFGIKPEVISKVRWSWFGKCSGESFWHREDTFKSYKLQKSRYLGFGAKALFLGVCRTYLAAQYATTLQSVPLLTSAAQGVRADTLGCAEIHEPLWKGVVSGITWR